MNLSALRVHRLTEFEDIFAAYLEGEASVKEVQDRAKKMLKVGLPGDE